MIGHFIGRGAPIHPATLVLCGPLLVLASGTLQADSASLPDPLEAGWKGEAVCEALHDDDEHRVPRCTFPPGVGHERHYHDRHFGYTIAGARMRITDAEGTREVDVPADSSFKSDGIEWHQVINVGDTTGVFLIVEAK